MSENKTPAPVNVTYTTKVSTDLTEAAIVITAFVWCVLCYGEPDLLDAAIRYLMRA